MRGSAGSSPPIDGGSLKRLSTEWAWPIVPTTR